MNKNPEHPVEENSQTSQVSKKGALGDKTSSANVEPPVENNKDTKTIDEAGTHGDVGASKDGLCTADETEELKKRNRKITEKTRCYRKDELLRQRKSGHNRLVQSGTSLQLLGSMIRAFTRIDFFNPSIYPDIFSFAHA